MKNKLLDIYKFITQVLIIFSITILIVSLISIFLGDDVKEYSSMFSLGKDGIAFSTIFQILLSSFVIAAINQIFLSEKFLKNMLTVWKLSLMVSLIIIVIVVFVICFKWFPLNLFEAWVGFFVSFGICFIISTTIMLTKTKIETKKYDELLENYKKKHSEIRRIENEDN